MAKLFDLRQELYRDAFEDSLPFEHYLESAQPHEKARWHSYARMIKISNEQESLIKSFIRQLNILVLSGSWCGDCARQGPIIHCIGEANPCISVRFAESSKFTALADELRIHGASRVPVALFLSEDFFEVARFGDRTLSSYRKKVQAELGPACDIGHAPTDPAELSGEIQDWVDQVERVEHLLRLSSLLRARYGD